MSSKRKEKVSNHNGSPSPMLRSSDDQGMGLDNGESSISNLMVVDRIAAILQPSASSHKDLDREMSESEDESGSDDEDNEMSDYEGSDEPDDLMTLDQYHTRIQKENLVRRIPQDITAPQKKGRLNKRNDAT